MLLNVHQWGPGDAPPVVCLHGGGQTAYMWEELGAAIGSSHYVLAPDLVAHLATRGIAASEDEARRLQGQDGDVTSVEAGTYTDQSILHWTERNLTYYQLGGSHEAPGLNRLRLDWAGAMASTSQDEPDYRIFQFFAQPNDGIFDPTGPTPPQRPTRYWRELEEDNVSVRLDLTVPLPSYNSKDNAIKSGGALSKSDRDFFQRGGGYIATSLSSANFSFLNGAQPALIQGTLTQSSDSADGGIALWNNVQPNGPITGGFASTDNLYLPANVTWFSSTPIGSVVDGRYLGSTSSMFLAGLWQDRNPAAAAAPMVVHGTTEVASRYVGLATNPFSRGDAEREWPLIGQAALWSNLTDG